MGYSFHEIELTHPIQAVDVPEACGGLAFVVRRAERPTGFVLFRCTETKPMVLEPEEVARILDGERNGVVLRDVSLNSGGLSSETPVQHRSNTLPTVTVAICTRDRPEELARCLESIRNLRIPPGVPAPEILVLDNAPSSERTRDLVLPMEEVRYVLESKPGLSFGRNRCLREARGELVAFIDDDACVDRGWLEGLFEAWQENPDAAAFTGLILPWELSTRAQILFELGGGFRRGFEKKRFGPSSHAGRFYPARAGIFGVGCNMAFRREALMRMGGFDEALGVPRPGGEDLDIFYRIIRSGSSIAYEPRFLAYHQHRRDYRGLRRQYWMWGLGFMAFLLKSYRTDREARPNLARAVAWWFPFQLYRLGRRLLGRDFMTFDLVLAQIWGGVVGLCGEYGRSLRRASRTRELYL